MRSRKTLILVVAASLFLGACAGGDEPTVEEVATTTAPSADDAARTSARTTDDTSTSSAAPRESSDTTAEPTSDATEDETADATPEETTTEAAPPAPAPEPCAADTISNDLLGYPGAVGTIVCEQGWVYAYYIEGTGDAEFVAQRQSGQWVHIATPGSPICREELVDMGAPQAVAADFTPCDLMYPPDPEPPVEDCLIPTEQYGATYAVPLIGVSCGEAVDRWYSAADNNPPSFDAPVISDGWECWVYPYDPGSWVAGSCRAVDGSAEFVLNVQ